MVHGRSLIVLAGMLFAATLSSALAPAADGASPAKQGLLVTVDDGVADVTAGDTLTYIITVQNPSNAVANDLLLTQNIPVDLEYVLADPGGTATSGSVFWDLDLEPNATKTFRTVMTVLATTTNLDQVASMVCVATAIDDAPQVCATDTDQLSRAEDAGRHGRGTGNEHGPLVVRRHGSGCPDGARGGRRWPLARRHRAGKSR